MSQYIIEYVNEVESTNDYLKEKVRNQNLKDPYCISAVKQTAGRGQREKTWISEPFANLITSFLAHVSSDINDLPRLNNAATLSIVKCLESFEVSNVRIKWPNDIYVNNSKIAGILIENVLVGSSIKNSIVGIGLNVNQQHFNTLNATSIKNETQKDNEITDVLLRLYDIFYETIKKESSELLSSINEILYKKDEHVTFEQDGRRTSYKVKGFLANGNLSAEYLGNLIEIEHHRTKWIK